MIGAVIGTVETVIRTTGADTGMDEGVSWMVGTGIWMVVELSLEWFKLSLEWLLGLIDLKEANKIWNTC